MKQATLSVDDFLTKKTKKRKSAPSDVAKSNKKQKADWRGRMTVVCKSSKSIVKNTKKSQLVAESLSLTVGENDNLVIFDDALLKSYLLTQEESQLLDERTAKFESSFKEQPTILKLSWKDRDGASLLGVKIKERDFSISSSKSDAQTFTLGKKSQRLWIASTSSCEKIALSATKGTQFLSMIPQFKGIVRVSVSGEISGAAKIVAK